MSSNLDMRHSLGANAAGVRAIMEAATCLKRNRSVESYFSHRMLQRVSITLNIRQCFDEYLERLRGEVDGLSMEFEKVGEGQSVCVQKCKVNRGRAPLGKTNDKQKLCTKYVSFTWILGIDRGSDEPEQTTGKEEEGDEVEEEREEGSRCIAWKPCRGGQDESEHVPPAIV
ncbi:hypothetical protein WN51_05124 [Melipona quadrifasciata]|uniref:Uncharacterized protein n=1 Tax=Melipona quadrifasciata TaxID=166423 RepID=A0A0M8ZRD6_9HYME|nr:hypothetical protein WN51_05124 [Melipona quadrifasciata]